MPAAFGCLSRRAAAELGITPSLRAACQPESNPLVLPPLAGQLRFQLNFTISRGVISACSESKLDSTSRADRPLNSGAMSGWLMETVPSYALPSPQVSR